MPKLQTSTLPKLLLGMNEWLTWENKPKKDGTFTKPPLSQRGHTVKADTPGCSLTQALDDIQYCGEHGGGVGFKLSDRNNLVFFDCDHVESLNDLPQSFKNFIEIHDTYMEWSPSGKGLRMIFECRDKESLPSKANLVGLDGELFVRSGFVTITGNHIAGEEIKEITAYQLEEWFKKATADIIPLITPYNHPNIDLIKNALSLCKLDQSDRVKKAYQIVMKQEYIHYDYWFKIMSACHNYATTTGQMAEITNIIVEWSQTDELTYESDEDVISHWESLSSKENAITYSTLFAFAKHLKFEWPVEKYTAKGEPTGKPVPTDLINLKALMDYHNLKFFWDIYSRNLYITGDKEIIPKLGTHFGMTGPFKESQLNLFICEFTQENGYSGVTIPSIMNVWKTYASTNIIEIDTFELWLKTPYEELPEDMREKNTVNHNIDYLMSCITFSPNQDLELIKTFFEAFFFEITMSIYNKENKYAQRSFILILQGPEACRKTTFCTMLFPANLRDSFITSSTEVLGGGGKSDRDFKIQLVGSKIVIHDEIESLLNTKDDAILKSLVTTDTIHMVPIYGKHTRKFKRNAAIIGTTNKSSFNFEVEGSRRLAIISVEWIDTSAMEKINWHHFYRHYVAEGRKAMINGVYPWKLDKGSIKSQYQENEQRRSHTDLEIMFRETFDFNTVIDYENATPQLHKGLYGFKQIESLLLQKYPRAFIKPSALKNELKRVCGSYTNTVNKRKPLRWENSWIENGIIRSGQWTKYVLPPLKTDFE